MNFRKRGRTFKFLYYIQRIHINHLYLSIVPSTITMSNNTIEQKITQFTSKFSSRSNTRRTRPSWNLFSFTSFFILFKISSQIILILYIKHWIHLNKYQKITHHPIINLPIITTMFPYNYKQQTSFIPLVNSSFNLPSEDQNSMDISIIITR